MGADLYPWIIAISIVVIMGALALRKMKVLVVAVIVGGFLAYAVLDPAGTVVPVLSAVRETLTSG